MMNRNTGRSYYGRRDWTNVIVQQLPGPAKMLPQTDGDARQQFGQRLKSPDPEAAPIADDCTPDPDRPQPARNALAHPWRFWGVFPGQGRFSPRHAPPRQLLFPHPDRNQPLTPSVSLLRPVGR